MEEGNDETSSEVVRLSAGCSTATIFGGEIEASDFGGANAESLGVERSTVPAGASIRPSIAQVLTGFGEVAGMRGLSVVVRSTGCKEIGTDISLSGGGETVRLSLTQSVVTGVGDGDRSGRSGSAIMSSQITEER